MDREAWWATVHRVAKSWTQLSNSSQEHKEDIIMFVLFYAELFSLDRTGLSSK